MKNQNKQFEIVFFNRLALAGHYETMSQDYYDFLLNSLSKNNINIRGFVLEAGCGEGIFGKLVLKKFPNSSIVGVDISENMVEIANDGVQNYHAIVADLENENLFVENYFDFILCPFILHHFMGLEAVFENFNKWIKNDGCIIILEPNGSNIVNKISKMLRKIVEMLLGKNFIINHGLATPNETDHTIRKYKKVLIKYNFSVLSIYSSFFVDKNRTSSYAVGRIKDALYATYRYIAPNYIGSGNNIIILAKSKK